MKEDLRCSTTSSLGSCLKFLTNFFCLVRFFWCGCTASSESESWSRAPAGGEAGGRGQEAGGGGLGSLASLLLLGPGGPEPARPMLVGPGPAPGQGDHL